MRQKRDVKKPSLGRRRVTVLHGSNDVYGASRVLVDDVIVLNRLGWEVTVVLPEDGPLTSLLVNAEAHIELQELHVLRRVSLAQTRIPVTLPAAAANAELVVLWTLALAAYLPALALHRKPCVCSVHEIQSGWSGALLAQAASRLSKGVMTNSVATKRWVEGYGRPRLSPIVAYPVAPRYDPYPMPDSNHPFNVLLAGRVNGRKGHIEAVEACDSVRAAGLDVCLTLLGSPYPGQEVHLASLREAIKGKDWIRYLGQVDSIRPFLADSHLLLVPSTKPESFGIVVLEAWAAGRQVIASDIGGLSEATDLIGGIRVPPNNDRQLADAIFKAFCRINRGEFQTQTALAPTRCSQSRRQLAWQALLLQVLPTTVTQYDG